MKIECDSLFQGVNRHGTRVHLQVRDGTTELEGFDATGDS